MSVVGTLVVSFGSSASSDSGSIKAEWDDTMNLDDEGEVKSQFVPGDQQYLLVHTDDTITIDAVKITDGSISSQGSVTFTRTQQLGFGDAEDVQTLSYNPKENPKWNWKGREGEGVSRSGKDVTVESNFPCLCIAEYLVEFVRYMIQHVSMDLAEEETYPFLVYIYYTDSSGDT